MSHSHFSASMAAQAWGGSRGQPVPLALQMYNKARSRPALQEIWSFLTGRSRSLLSLDRVENDCTVRGSHYAGTQTVPIRQIRGSEGRCGDFDADFRPLNSRNEGRWLNVAAAQQKGMTLPPVDLIQVGDIYFVQDGHHRVSVAKAWGQERIEAKVTIWEVEGPLPWKRSHPRPA